MFAQSFLPYRAPAPGPVLGALDESGADGVKEDVPTDVARMLLAVDDTGREPCSEEVPFALAATVHALGVDAVEALHAGREPLLPGRDDEVVVRRHQAPGVHLPLVAADALCEQPEERDAVDVVEKRGRAVDRNRPDMEEPVAERRPEDPRHGSKLVRREP